MLDFFIAYSFFGGGGTKSLSGSLFGSCLGCRCFGFCMIFVTVRLGWLTFFDRGDEPLPNISEPVVPRCRGVSPKSVSQSVTPYR